jgi:hypothetical protein
MNRTLVTPGRVILDRYTSRSFLVSIGMEFKMGADSRTGMSKYLGKVDIR